MSSFDQLCYRHPGREAVARCPACLHFFCRECVTEHAGRMLCSNCLSRLSDGRAEGGRLRMEQMVIFMQGAFGMALLWYFFFLLGQILLAIPHAFHEGAIWQADWWRKP
ncbi:MAG: rhomboid family protein [Desulfobacteraceae bacterium]|nr:MAG: rhomboid family protein [Desulfobacteraceae bacterium]